MPAQITESAMCIEDRIRSSLNSVTNNSQPPTLDERLLSAAVINRIMNTEIKFNVTQILNGDQDSQSSNEKMEKKEDGIPTPRIVIYSPENIRTNWLQVKRIGAGLINPNNTCFLNSVLQCLTYTPPLVNYLFSDDHSKKCRTSGFCATCELQAHIRRCFENFNRTVKPQVFISKLRLISKNMHHGEQEDAHEFMRQLLLAMQKCCLHGHQKLDFASQETTAINQIFGGWFCSQIICSNCKNTSNSYEPFSDISLEIKNANTLSRAFDRFTEAEKLHSGNSYKCDRCKKMVNASKRFTIHKAPNVLCVHFKRFTNGGNKIDRQVQFSEKLNLRPWMTEKHGEAVKYSLYGVLVHSGNSHFGHYYAYVKPSNGIWHLMNDSFVNPVNVQRVLNAHAYILFYIKDASPRGVKASPAQTSVQRLQNGPSITPPASPMKNGGGIRNMFVPGAVKNIVNGGGMKLVPKGQQQQSPIKAPTKIGRSNGLTVPSSKFMKQPLPTPIITPTNPLVSGPIVSSSINPTSIPSQEARQKISFSINKTKPAEPPLPKVVMQIIHGKVNYKESVEESAASKPVSPASASLSPVKSSVNQSVQKQIPKKLVAYDDDSTSSGEEETTPVVVNGKTNGHNGTNGLTNGTTNGQNGHTNGQIQSPANSSPKKQVEASSSKESNSPKREVQQKVEKNHQSFKPVLDSSLTTTTQVPGWHGSLDKVPKKEHRVPNSSPERWLSIGINPSPPEAKRARATTPNWNVREEDDSPDQQSMASIASSTASNNSTTDWIISSDKQAKKKKHKHRKNHNGEPSSYEQGWCMSPTKSAFSLQQCMSASMDTNSSPSKKHANVPCNNIFPEDSHVASSSSNGVEASSTEQSIEAVSLKECNGDDSQNTDNHVASEPISNGLLDTGCVNGDDQSSEKKKKKKKKKKKRKRDREEGELLDNEKSTDAPPKKKKKKACTETESPQNKSSQSTNESELEEGEWVEVTKDTLTQKKTSTSESSSGNSVQNTSENTSESPTKSPSSMTEAERKHRQVNAPVQDWDYHRKRARGEIVEPLVWNTQKDPAKDKELHDYFYNQRIPTWEGGMSELDKAKQRERKAEQKKKSTWEYKYEEQLDQGRLWKKQKRALKAKEEAEALAKGYQPYNKNDRHKSYNGNDRGGSYNRGGGHRGHHNGSNGNHHKQSGSEGGGLGLGGGLGSGQQNNWQGGNWQKRGQHHGGSHHNNHQRHNSYHQ